MKIICLKSGSDYMDGGADEDEDLQIKLGNSLITHQLASKPGSGVGKICLPKGLKEWILKHGVKTVDKSRFNI